MKTYIESRTKSKDQDIASPSEIIRLAGEGDVVAMLCGYYGSAQASGHLSGVGESKGG